MSIWVASLQTESDGSECWLAKGEGDPPRTYSLDHAAQFSTERGAYLAICKARKRFCRSFPEAVTRPAYLVLAPLSSREAAQDPEPSP